MLVDSVSVFLSNPLPFPFPLSFHLSFFLSPFFLLSFLPQEDRRQAQMERKKTGGKKRGGKGGKVKWGDVLVDLPSGYCAAATGTRHRVHNKCLQSLQCRDRQANLSSATSPSSASSASSSSSSSSFSILGDNKAEADVTGDVKGDVKGVKGEADMKADMKDVFGAPLSEKGGCPRCVDLRLRMVSLNTNGRAFKWYLRCVCV